MQTQSKQQLLTAHAALAYDSIASLACFKQLNALNVYRVYEINICLHMHKYANCYDSGNTAIKCC